MLFTRKKQQAIPSTEVEDGESATKTDGKKKGAVQALSEDALENQETEVQSTGPSVTSASTMSSSQDKPAAKKRGRKSKAEKEQLEREKKEELVKVTEMKFPTTSWRGTNAGPSSCIASESFKVITRFF